jgi:hypothetical protein
MMGVRLQYIMDFKISRQEKGTGETITLQIPLVARLRVKQTNVKVSKTKELNERKYRIEIESVWSLRIKPLVVGKIV